MTCREFKHTAASLTLWELSRSQDASILGHAEACRHCGAWFENQRSLAASMQTLQSSTASREAGPSVEQALLRAFRQVPRTEAVTASVRGKERSKPLLSGAALRSTPMTMRLSRWFEVGAYAAIAAAIVVGVFLGIRLLRDRQMPGPTQSPAAAVENVPVAHQPDVAAAEKAPSDSQAAKATPAPIVAVTHREWRPRPSAASTTQAEALPAADDSQTTAELGYMPLMICDPLSCSSDTQVVRMELPHGTDAQPQVADVVVGYDGVVRAVRIVN